MHACVVAPLSSHATTHRATKTLTTQRNGYTLSFCYDGLNRARFGTWCCRRAIEQGSCRHLLNSRAWLLNRIAQQLEVTYTSLSLEQWLVMKVQQWRQLMHQ
jgi:hypothetical protein